MGGLSDMVRGRDGLQDRAGAPVPHEAVRGAMRAISEISRSKLAIYYSLTGEEYEEVMREVEGRLKAELKVVATA